MTKLRDRLDRIWFYVGDGKWSTDKDVSTFTECLPTRSGVEAAFGPLIEVIDTGEPLDADPDSMSYEEAEYWCRMDDYDAAEDTPRNPEPGDRVPKIGDTVAVPLNDENGTIIVGSLVATYDDKFWIEGDDFDLQVPHQGSRITVIEPARPAVPDEYYGVPIPEGLRPNWNDNRVEVSWWKQGVQAAVFDADERGPVIGG